MAGYLINIEDKTLRKRVLWSDRIEPNGGGVIAYNAGGKQRIAIASGMKSPIWPVQPKSSRIVVYGLP